MNEETAYLTKACLRSNNIEHQRYTDKTHWEKTCYENILRPYQPKIQIKYSNDKNYIYCPTHKIQFIHRNAKYEESCPEWPFSLSVDQNFSIPKIHKHTGRPTVHTPVEVEIEEDLQRTINSILTSGANFTFELPETVAPDTPDSPSRIFQIIVITIALIFGIYLLAKCTLYICNCIYEVEKEWMKIKKKKNETRTEEKRL